jgi:dTDP-4-amino-4,6-dideoxygalactose transaminase
MEAGSPEIRPSTFRQYLIFGSTRPSGSWILVVAIALSLVVAWADYVTGTEIGFFPAYLAVVIFATWMSGNVGVGLATSAVCAVGWLTGDALLHRQVSSPWVIINESALRITFLVGFTVALAKVKARLRKYRTEAEGEASDSLAAIRSASNYLIFGQPCIEEQEIREVVKSMRTGWLGSGKKVLLFEEMMREYKGVQHAVAVNSCTSGLQLSCQAAGLQPGDEVITTAMTFCATINAISNAGATPVIADIDPKTYNLDPDEILRRITPRTKAIMPVHFAGRPCDMERIMAIATEHRLKVIEDCAHAIETKFRGQHAGTFGACGVLSFYSTKNITTGEGGMVLTNDAAFADRIRAMALHGLSTDAWQRFLDDGYKHYEVMEAGTKANMMDLQAAIGIHQLPRIERYSARRLEIWNRYLEAFADLPLECPPPLEPESSHALHLFTVLIDSERAGFDRDFFIRHLHRDNVGIGVHYRQIAEHHFYQQRFGWRPSDYPHAAAYGQQTVSLPLSPRLRNSDVNDVIMAVRRVFHETRAARA